MPRLTSAAIVLALAATLGCRHPPKPQDASGFPAAEVEAADSLVLTVSDSLTVWFAAGRTATDSTGRACVERSVKIVSPTITTVVPLLYTGRAPVVADRTSLTAELWKDCRPIARYRIDLATGRPTKLPDR